MRGRSETPYVVSYEIGLVEFAADLEEGGSGHEVRVERLAIEAPSAAEKVQTLFQEQQQGAIEEAIHPAAQ